jgi:hypothetical protein
MLGGVCVGGAGAAGVRRRDASGLLASRLSLVDRLLLYDTCGP